MASCPCGSGIDLEDCCGPIVAGEKPAPTAEALMRSRYTAFALGALDHIERTYAPEKRDLLNPPGVRSSAGFLEVEWVGLEIFETAGGGEADNSGTVDFAARFRKDGRVQVHRERSAFRRDDGHWVYVDGSTPDPGTAGKVGRNDPCSCGSGRKFKRCCGR